MPGSDVEVLSFAVTVATIPDPVAAAGEVFDTAAPKAPRRLAVRDTATGEVADWPVYERDAFTPGAAVSGPAIVAEAETSTLVGRGWRCRMDGLGYLELAQEAPQ